MTGRSGPVAGGTGGEGAGPPLPRGRFRLDGILFGVNRRCSRPLAAALLSLALLPLRGVAQVPSPPTQPVPPAQSVPPTQSASGGEIAVPIVQTFQGPLFSLSALVDRLGGHLERGVADDSYRLELAGEPVVVGAGSPTATIGTEIVHLPQAPVAGEGGLYVPLVFLERTFGDLAGYRFRWDAQAGRLVIGRRTPRDVPVTVDVVHLQGVSTVVLGFSQEPRYRIAQKQGEIDVELVEDRIQLPARPPSVRDPLVERIDLLPDAVHIELAPGAAADSYTLDDPFRLVFDVHREAVAAAPAGSQPAAPQPPVHREGVRTIVLDPGHGGSETGAIGPSGAEEKDLVLLLARALKTRLEQRMPVRVVLTRSEDAALPLDTRSAIANQNKADLFISLHLNSASGHEAHGAETYFLSLEASDERAARAADLENQSPADGAGAASTDGDGDPLYDLQLILWDLAQSHHLSESQHLATLIQEELNGALDLRDRGVKQAPFRVLMGAAMPAVLVELGFLSNPSEERKLEDPAYRSDLVEALTRAVMRYRAQLAAKSDGGGGRPGEAGR